jgi:hypothetical protein
MIGSDEIAPIHPSIRSREISPELVLVDPELARVARVALTLQAETPAPAPATPTALAATLEPRSAAPLYYALDTPQFARSAVVHTVEPVGRREGIVVATRHLLSHLTPAILFGSLLVNLALGGVLLGESDLPDIGQPGASTEPLHANSQHDAAGTAAATRAPHRQATLRRTNKGASAKAIAERTVLGLVQTAPRSRITALIDPRSGLLKNNVQAVCRRHPGRDATRFLCVVRPAGAAHGAGLYVKYTGRPRGRWSVSWLGYRKG